LFVSILFIQVISSSQFSFLSTYLNPAPQTNTSTPPASTSTPTTKMSTTTSSVSATNTASCGGSVWQIPTTDAACAAIVSGNVTDVMDQCCKDASPRKYDNDCGIYCLAQGQDIGTLQSCITSKSGNYHDVFCNTSRQNATASAAATKTSSTSSGTTDTSTSTSTHNAAVANQPASKSGLGLVALMFGSAFMAAFS
jgi:type IV secretory pathway VirJ component